MGLLAELRRWSTFSSLAKTSHALVVFLARCARRVGILKNKIAALGAGKKEKDKSFFLSFPLFQTKQTLIWSSRGRGSRRESKRENSRLFPLAISLPGKGNSSPIPSEPPGKRRGNPQGIPSCQFPLLHPMQVALQEAKSPPPAVLLLPVRGPHPSVALYGLW